MLYFQFDRHRVGTIRSEWVRAIFRMDRRMETLADVNARYGDELAEASSYSTDSVRLLGGRNSPIVVATLLISLGWTLLVVQTDSFDFAGSSEIAALAQVATTPPTGPAPHSTPSRRAAPIRLVGAATARSAADQATLGQRRGRGRRRRQRRQRRATSSDDRRAGRVTAPSQDVGSTKRRPRPRPRPSVLRRLRPGSSNRSSSSSCRLRAPPRWPSSVPTSSAST